MQGPEGPVGEVGEPGEPGLPGEDGSPGLKGNMVGNLLQPSSIVIIYDKKKQPVSLKGCKESQFYSLPFRQAIARMY